MRETLDIIEALKRSRQNDVPSVLASVVRVHGSTYRRPGARALFMADNEIIGLIGGGCLEADLLLQADEIRELGRPKLITYDNTADTDIIWGLGLGCNGKIDILLEPVEMDDPQQLDIIYRCFSARKTGMLATVIQASDPSQLAARYLLAEDGHSQKTKHWNSSIDLGECIGKLITEDSLKPSAKKKPQVFTTGDSEILIEYLQLVTRLVIVGAGPDAVPLVELAAQIGWQIDVFDHREAFARQEQFSGAQSVSVVPVAEIAAQVQVDDKTAVVLMTHHYTHDLELLKGFILTAAGYIGVLGPKARLNLLLDDLHAHGLETSSDQLQRLRGPVGLNLGAETPQEIALSIVAEIQACFTQHDAAPLNDSLKPIHD